MITTERLVLRDYTLADAAEMFRLINDREIAFNTLRIPFPYPEGEAERWISSRGEEKNDHVFAVTLRKDEALVGTVGLHVRAENDHAEIGYWIGAPYWDHGYATEAAAAVMRFGFESLSLNKIFANHFSRNPASGKVLEKLGMRHEGTLRQHLKKWGHYVDLECYGILRSDWQERAGSR